MREIQLQIGSTTASTATSIQHLGTRTLGTTFLAVSRVQSPSAARRRRRTSMVRLADQGAEATTGRWLFRAQEFQQRN
jgi:hypothetical protein